MTKNSAYKAKSLQLGHIRPVKHLLLGKVRKKLFRRNRKSFCQLYDILQGYIPFASFYPADVVAMQSRTFGQFLLRVAAFIAQPSQRGSQWEGRHDGAQALESERLIVSIFLLGVNGSESDFSILSKPLI
jgi:hypothetical protein